MKYLNILGNSATIKGSKDSTPGKRQLQFEASKDLNCIFLFHLVNREVNYADLFQMCDRHLVQC